MKKYKLKPGVHQFAPGSHAVHQNDNLSDDEAEWYLARYPHIAALFEENPVSPKVGKTERRKEEAAAIPEVSEPSIADVTGHFIIQ